MTVAWSVWGVVSFIALIAWLRWEGPLEDQKKDEHPAKERDRQAENDRSLYTFDHLTLN